MTSLIGPSLRVMAALIVGVGMAVGAITWAGVAPWSSGDYKLKVLAPTAGSLAQNSGVRISGVEVGRVTSIARAGDSAEIEIGIQKGKVPVPEDSRALLRLRTLVGESYIEIQPGRSAHPLRSGSKLPLVQEDGFVESDKVLSILKGRARENARSVIRRLGRSVDGQGERFNSFLSHASGAVQNASGLVAILELNRKEVAGIVRNLGDLMSQIGERQAAIRSAARNGTTTFQALADRDRALRQVFSELPATLQSVRIATDTLQNVSGVIAPELSNLSEAVVALRPAVEGLRPAAGAGDDLLQQLATTGPRLQPTLRALRKAAGPVATAVPDLGKTLCQVNPMLRYLAPYHKDAAAIIHNMGSATSFYDATGHAARLYAQVGHMSVGAIPGPLKGALDALITNGLIGESNPQGYNPYPKPETLSDPGSGGGLGASGPSDKPVKFPRVEADC